MFKIGDEVMDRSGRSYTVMGVGFATYELIDSDGKMQDGILEHGLAKYDSRVAEALQTMSEGIGHVEDILNRMKDMHVDIFEKARRKT